MKGWSSDVEKVVFRQRMAVSWWSLVETSGLGAELFVKVLKRAVLVAVTCLFVLGKLTSIFMKQERKVLRE